MKNFILLSTFILSTLELRAGEESSKAGPKKALLRADEHEGFELKEGVAKRFEIDTLVLGAKPWRIPRQALVYSKQDIQVFRLRDRLWKSIAVTIERQGDSALIRSEELAVGDEIAVRGSQLLKVIELDAFSEEDAGHVH